MNWPEAKREEACPGCEDCDARDDDCDELDDEDDFYEEDDE